jgi:molecular chaperone GrpE
MQTEETQMKQAFENAQNLDESQNIEEIATENVEAQNDVEPEVENAAEENQESTFDVKEILAENEQLRLQMTALETKHKEEIDRLVRAVAETENQKKRIEADVERERKYGNEKLLKALIPVVDSLELALQHTDPNNEAVKPTIEGVQNTVTLLLKELSKFGVTAVDPLNQPFDPNLHQAISMAPSNEVEANRVMSVMQKGYTLNGRVVRPAMVIVSRGAPQEANAEEAKNTINIEA